MAMRSSRIDACAFPVWFAAFRRLSIRSAVLAIPASDGCDEEARAFINYLHQDGLFLPLDENGMPHPFSTNSNSDSDNDDDVSNVSDNDHDSGSNSNDQDTTDDWSADKIPHFPILQSNIKQAIEDLGGTVFVKFNWSSPKDASYMTIDGTLKCKSVQDIFLLLKSSDFIAHDLSHAYDCCYDEENARFWNDAPVPADLASSLLSSSLFSSSSASASASASASPISTSLSTPPIPTESESDTATPTNQLEKSNDERKTVPDKYYLILRKWVDLHPSMEFRCFVKNNDLIGISQRDHMNHYPFLIEARQELEASIIQFFNDNVKGVFPDHSYVFDIYINKGNKKIWILDFNPFVAKTDPLLFTWDELLAYSGPPTLRIVTNTTGGPLGLQPMFATNRLPREAVDLSQGVSLAEFAERVAREFEAMKTD